MTELTSSGLSPLTTSVSEDQERAFDKKPQLNPLKTKARYQPQKSTHAHEHEQSKLLHEEMIDIDEEKNEISRGQTMRELKRKEALEANKLAIKKLKLVLGFAMVFTCVEIMGGAIADSIAIMSDAAHIACDVFGFGISIVAL